MKASFPTFVSLALMTSNITPSRTAVIPPEISRVDWDAVDFETMSVIARLVNQLNAEPIDETPRNRRNLQELTLDLGSITKSTLEAVREFAVEEVQLLRTNPDKTLTINFAKMTQSYLSQTGWNLVSAWASLSEQDKQKVRDFSKQAPEWTIDRIGSETFGTVFWLAVALTAVLWIESNYGYPVFGAIMKKIPCCNVKTYPEMVTADIMAVVGSAAQNGLDRSGLRESLNGLSAEKVGAYLREVFEGVIPSGSLEKGAEKIARNTVRSALGEVTEHFRLPREGEARKLNIANAVTDAIVDALTGSRDVELGESPLQRVVRAGVSALRNAIKANIPSETQVRDQLNEAIRLSAGVAYDNLPNKDALNKLVRDAVTDLSAAVGSAVEDRLQGGGGTYIQDKLDQSMKLFVSDVIKALDSQLTDKMRTRFQKELSNAVREVSSQIKSNFPSEENLKEGLSTFVRAAECVVKKRIPGQAVIANTLDALFSTLFKSAFKAASAQAPNKETVNAYMVSFVAIAASAMKKAVGAQYDKSASEKLREEFKSIATVIFDGVLDSLGERMSDNTVRRSINNFVNVIVSAIDAKAPSVEQLEARAQRIAAVLVRVIIRAITDHFSSSENANAFRVPMENLSRVSASAIIRSSTSVLLPGGRPREDVAREMVARVLDS